MYLYGRKKFTLVADHKPLLAILGPKTSLHTLVAARLQRWAITLAAYHYDIKYRPTSKMGNANALFRFPVDKAPGEYDDSILLVSVHDVPITAKDIAHNTKKDPILCKVLESLMTGADKSIELSVRNCMKWVMQQKNPQFARMHPCELSRYPWQRVHIDFAGPFSGYLFLIVVDAYKRIVTVKGPQFTSQEFQEFCEVNGIKSNIAQYCNDKTCLDIQNKCSCVNKLISCKCDTGQTSH
ncbi:uncharacterized protein [Palaemon carinicauda]|uniref:uncharacterized protein n=1 Tax=Palaemon carinicauda TaxID=392227 RepID=UPI0035B5F6A3